MSNVAAARSHIAERPLTLRILAHQAPGVLGAHRLPEGVLLEVERLDERHLAAVRLAVFRDPLDVAKPARRRCRRNEPRWKADSRMRCRTAGPVAAYAVCRVV